jgi:Mn-containing catalase
MSSLKQKNVNKLLKITKMKWARQMIQQLMEEMTTHQLNFYLSLRTLKLNAQMIFLEELLMK